MQPGDAEFLWRQERVAAGARTLAGYLARRSTCRATGQPLARCQAGAGGGGQVGQARAGQVVKGAGGADT